MCVEKCRLSQVQFIIVQDYKERVHKCTATPLRDLPGFAFIRVSMPKPREEPLVLKGGIWLDVDAPILERADRKLLGQDGRVIVLDASWQRVGPLERRIRIKSGGSLNRRSLPSVLRTVYPRKSKVYDDPGAGLATVEAIFAATVLLGEPRPEVLEKYYWAQEFLDRNRTSFLEMGWEASDATS